MQKLARATKVLAEGRFERKSHGEIRWVVFSISQGVTLNRVRVREALKW